MPKHMDSVTQAVLGGAVGHAVLGNKIGRKAAIWGVVLGTLPDLDVLLPYAGEVEAFTYHRGFSHSLIVQLLISPIIVWLLLKLHKNTHQYKKEWFWLVFLCLSTHALLDSFTVYGTQLLWPITEYPFGIANLFIIDPMYTLPLLIGLLIALLPSKNKQSGYKINIAGIILSTMYILWSLGAKFYIDNKVQTQLSAKGITSEHYVSTPAPLSTLLWRIVVVSQDHYYEIYASIFDSPNQISIYKYNDQKELLNQATQFWGVQRLQWFTKGLYAVYPQKEKIVLTDLRMGAECNYVFNFVVGEQTNIGVIEGSYEKITQRPDISEISKVWDRIWDANVSLASRTDNNACPNPRQE